MLLTTGVAAGLTLFLPLIAITYSLFRRERRVHELGRIFDLLKLSAQDRRIYEVHHAGLYLAAAVVFCSVIAWAGLTVLLTSLRDTLQPEAAKLLPVQEDVVLIFGVAFLGAYLWGVRYVLRRYTLNDLTPAVYYTLSVRMILASTLAVLIYAAFTALAPGVGLGSAWPAAAFLIGTFPQRGVHWLTARLPMLAPEADQAVHSMPLEKIQGIALLDRMRLEEVGIDSCYDLATADFVPLILKTPYGARELIDWILQAKLCVHVGDAVKELREQGIRTVVDLAEIEDEQLARLAAETPATKPALDRAALEARDDKEIARLLHVGLRIGRYWDNSQETPPASSEALE